MCRHCWELRISNIKAGISNTPGKTRKPKKKEKLPIDKPAQGLEATEFIAPEPAVHNQQKVESPAYPVKENFIPYEPSRHMEPPAHAKPIPTAEPITNKKPKMFFEPEELTPPYHPMPVDVPAVLVEQATQLEPKEPTSQVSHVEPAAQAPWPPAEPMKKHEESAESIIYLGPSTYAPQPIYVEPEPKPKLDIGNKTRRLLGSLSKLKPRFSGKGKQQEEAHHTQVAQQTFQCHQCDAENKRDAQFCQGCGAWFQATELAPQSSYAESEPQVPWSADEQLTNYEETKPKLDLGKMTRGLFGSRLNPKPGSGGKGKQQKETHYVQVAQQTFQCHQCGTENYIGELFCQGCGSWFQYTCPDCGAVVDPGFDSCPSCFTELGWGHTAEEEYHGYP
jgi:hypothetical protein